MFARHVTCTEYIIIKVQSQNVYRYNEHVTSDLIIGDYSDPYQNIFHILVSEIFIVSPVVT